MSTRPSTFHAPQDVDAPTDTQPVLNPCLLEEEQRLADALAAGFPFLVWRDHDGAQRIFVLGADGRLTIGRRASCSVVLNDDLVSRVHAALEPIAGDWALLDDGISRHGTFVNGEQIVSRRLVDGDRLRFGKTEMMYRRPPRKGSVLTVSSSSLADTRTVTDVQRAVLIALARPYRRGASLAAPASNGAIAKEVRLSLDAVKGHLDVLCRRFEIADPTSAQRRVRLVECALQWGLISESDLG
ncbi:MAG: FHA domain-containing protein [Solirubrobacteraceae bacterium]